MPAVYQVIQRPHADEPSFPTVAISRWNPVAALSYVQVSGPVATQSKKPIALLDQMIQ